MLLYPHMALTFCSVLTSSCLRFISASVDCLRSFFNNTATGQRGGRKEKRGEMRREGGREGRKGEISGKDKEVSMEEQVAILVVYQPGPSLTLKKSGGWEMVWHHYSLFHTISDSFHERAKHFAASLWAKLSWYKRKSQHSTISYPIVGKKTIVECSQVPPKDDTPQILHGKLLWIARKSQKFPAIR